MVLTLLTYGDGGIILKNHRSVAVVQLNFRKNFFELLPQNSITVQVLILIHFLLERICSHPVGSNSYFVVEQKQCTGLEIIFCQGGITIVSSREHNEFCIK